jgi:hypothetical protein
MTRTRIIQANVSQHLGHGRRTADPEVVVAEPQPADLAVDRRLGQRHRPVEADGALQEVVVGGVT